MTYSAEEWLERAAQDPDRPGAIGVACPKCWKPIYSNNLTDTRYCQCNLPTDDLSVYSISQAHGLESIPFGPREYTNIEQP